MYDIKEGDRFEWCGAQWIVCGEYSGAGLVSACRADDNTIERLFSPLTVAQRLISFKAESVREEQPDPVGQSGPGLDMGAYQAEVERTVSPLAVGRVEVAVIGLVAEAGEVAGILKKRLERGGELENDRAVEELGDTLWYLARCAKLLGSSLEEVAQANIRKLRARHPDGYRKEWEDESSDE